MFNSVNTITSWGLTGDHKAALQLPFFHIGGPNIFMVPLVHTGGTTILCSGFDPDETFDLVESGGITHYVAVPTMFQMMLDQQEVLSACTLKTVRFFISGGAPCPIPTKTEPGDGNDSLAEHPKNRFRGHGCAVTSRGGGWSRRSG